MDVTLSTKTQQLIADHMSRYGYATADDLIRDVLGDADTDDGDGGESDDDPGLVAALAEGDAQADRGETIAWEDVKAEIKARYNLP